MKLAYKTLPKTMAGSAVPGCGTIHISEIEPTLTQLSHELNFPFNLNDYTLGSTGKREYSGDIDLVIDPKLLNCGIPEFRKKLEELFGREYVARNGNMLHIKYPIVKYKEELEYVNQRTGFVQIDFNFGDVEWEKIYHFSPGSESRYKGAHRNLMLSAICAAVNTIDSREVDTYNRPIEQIRMKFGPHGLFKVRRTSQKDDRTGVWMKKQHDEILAGPYKDVRNIVKILFSANGKETDIRSLESIMGAVKRNYGMTDCERIWKRAAMNFYDWPEGRNFHYPEEIGKYFIEDDK